MRKLLALLLIIGCATGSSIKTATPEDPGAPNNSEGYQSLQIRRQFESTMLIYVNCGNGEEKLGSGVLIGPDKIITAKHVISCTMGNLPEAIMVKNTINQEANAVITKKAAIADAALLTTDKLFEVYSNVKPYNKNLGMRVCDVTGYTHALKCGSLVYKLNNYLYISQLHTYHGDSGSPIFDYNGSVVGIISGMLEFPNGESITVGTDSLAFTDLLS